MGQLRQDIWVLQDIAAGLEPQNLDSELLEESKKRIEAAKTKNESGCTSSDILVKLEQRFCEKKFLYGEYCNNSAIKKAILNLLQGGYMSVTDGNGIKMNINTFDANFDGNCQVSWNESISEEE